MYIHYFCTLFFRPVYTRLRFFSSRHFLARPPAMLFVTHVHQMKEREDYCWWDNPYESKVLQEFAKIRDTTDFRITEKPVIIACVALIARDDARVSRDRPRGFYHRSVCLSFPRFMIETSDIHTGERLKLRRSRDIYYL